MEKKRKTTAQKTEKIVDSDIKTEVEGEVKKSKVTLFWEEYPNGILEIVDMRAVLK
jgi:hypothetical protein